MRQNTPKLIKVGLIGVGKMGENHLRILSMLKNISVEFIYDIDKEKAAYLAEKYAVSATVDIEQSLSKVDAVAICSPTHMHYKHLMLVSQFVSHIFVEKPLTDSLATSERVISLAKERCLTIQVGFIERFNPAIQALNRILKNGINVLNIDFERTNRLSDRITDIDVIYDLMIHDIDLALYLNGDIANITANGIIRNNMIAFATANFIHKNGTLSRILASRITEKKFRHIRVTCENLFIDCELLRKEIIINRQSKTESGVGQHISIANLQETVVVPPQEALLDELTTFFHKSVDANVQVPDEIDGLNAIRVCDQIKDIIWSNH